MPGEADSKLRVAQNGKGQLERFCCLRFGLALTVGSQGVADDGHPRRQHRPLAPKGETAPFAPSLDPSVMYVCMYG